MEEIKLCVADVDQRIAKIDAQLATLETEIAAAESRFDSAIGNQRREKVTGDALTVLKHRQSELAAARLRAGQDRRGAQRFELEQKLSARREAKKDADLEVARLVELRETKRHELRHAENAAAMASQRAADLNESIRTLERELRAFDN